MSKSTNPRRVTTGEVRLSYANLFVPRLNELSGKEEFSTMVLVPKTDEATIAAMRAAAKAALEAKWGAKLPQNLRNPMRDGDVEHPGAEPYAGHYFLNVKSAEAPQVVDERVVAITNPRDLGSGDYARVVLDAFGYEAKGNRGVSFGLIAVQRVRKGTPLGSRVRAEDVFAPIDGGAAAAEFDPLQ